MYKIFINHERHKKSEIQIVFTTENTEDTEKKSLTTDDADLCRLKDWRPFLFKS